MKSASLLVFDISGRLMHEYNDVPGDEKFIFGSDLLPGIYFLQIKQDEETETVRILKTQ